MNFILRISDDYSIVCKYVRAELRLTLNLISGVSSVLDTRFINCVHISMSLHFIHFQKNVSVIDFNFDDLNICGITTILNNNN